MSFLNQFDERISTIDQREAELQATIQERLDELARERSEALSERHEALFDYLVEQSPGNLLNSEKAGELYELGFDRGLGNEGFTILYENLVSGTYLSPHPNWWSLSGETALVKVPTMVYQESYDEAVLSESIKLLEELYEAAREINPTVYVIFYGYEDLYKAKRDGASWNLYLPNGLVKTNYGSFAELFELELRGR